MTKNVTKSKITLDKLAQMTHNEFLVTDRKIDEIRGKMATKDDLKHFATKDDLKDLKEDIRSDTAEILQKVDKIVKKFDAAEKDHAAHTVLHKRITDELHGHDQRIKKLKIRA